MVHPQTKHKNLDVQHPVQRFKNRLEILCSRHKTGLKNAVNFQLKHQYMNEEMTRNLLIRMASGQTKPKRIMKRQANSLKSSDSPKNRRTQLYDKTGIYQAHDSFSVQFNTEEGLNKINTEPVFPLLSDYQDKAPLYNNCYNNSVSNIHSLHNTISRDSASTSYTFTNNSYKNPATQLSPYGYIEVNTSAYVPNLSRPYE